jgi:hypothetical protein
VVELKEEINMSQEQAPLCHLYRLKLIV